MATRVTRLGLRDACRFFQALAVAVVMAAVQPARGRFVVEKSSVRVLAPEHIRGHHDAAIGNFGVPHYGGTLTGVVLYPDAKATGCAEFPKKFKSKSRRPVILLLDRGECYFALKSWNAQQAGAAAVLIADSVDEQLLTMDTPGASPDTEYIDKINIPSALVNRAFGESLKRMAEKAGVDAAPGRAGGVRAVDEQQRRVRPAVRRAGGVRAELPGPHPDPGARRLRALHPALHHLVLPRGVQADEAVPVAVHQPRQVLRAGPGAGLRRRVRGEGRGGGEPAAAVRAPGGQRHGGTAVGVVGLRHGLQAAVLDEGEEVQQGVRGGGGCLAGAAAGRGAGVHGRPRGRRGERRPVQGAGGPDWAWIARGRDHPAHAGHQRRSVQREAGEDGGAEGRVRRVQGGDRTSRLPQRRHGDERVPAPERWVLARPGHQRDRLQGHVQGQGVRVPRGERRPIRGRRVHALQSCRAGQVRAEPRRVLVGDPGGTHLLRLLGQRADRVPLPVGVPRRRPHMQRSGRVQGEAGVHLPRLPLQQHLGQLRLRLQQGQPDLHSRRGRLHR